jgi:hypothetical protein
MTTKNEAHTSINMLISIMQARGARPYVSGDSKRLTWQHHATGYSLVWEDRSTGGVSVIARLGNTKPEVVETCRRMMDILDTIGRSN